MSAPPSTVSGMDTKSTRPPSQGRAHDGIDEDFSSTSASPLIDPLLHAHMARISPPPASTLDDSPGPPAGCEPDAIKLFVGNIPKSCTEQQLLPLFQSVGHVVELAIMRDRETSGGSKGSAFLWYSTRAAADMAIQKFHLRYILNDPVGENNRRLVLRRARARGDGSAAPAAAPSAGGGGPGDAASGAAQVLRVSTSSNPPAAAAPPGAHQQAAPNAAGAGSQRGKSPMAVQPGYQPLGLLPATGLQPRQPPAQGMEPGPSRAPPAWSGQRDTASSPLPTSPNLASLAAGTLPPAISQSARCSSRPSPSEYPQQLLTNAMSLGQQLSAGQLSNQFDLLSMVQRGAAGPRPYSMNAAIGLSGHQEASGAPRSGHGPAAHGPGLPHAPAAVNVTTIRYLESQQLHLVIDYLHSVQEVCRAEISVALPPVPGCFEVRVSGSQHQVQAGVILIDGILSSTYH